MKKIKLGKTNIKVTKVAFGVLPLQRIDIDSAKVILKKAYNKGINFYDTARAYSDSEEKIGNALSDVRENIIIATKTHSKNPGHFWSHLHTSLKTLKTEYIDIYQFHNPSKVYKPNDGTGMYEAMLEAKAQGKIRHIGITSHKLQIASEAIESNLYETLQYPLSYISSENDFDIYEKCITNGMGFIAMKALCGGLLTDAKIVFLFFEKMKEAVPIYGIQKASELDEFISYANNTPIMDDEIIKKIETDKKELAGNFCRGCGYCLPCPSGIEINTVARMSFLLRRAVWQDFVTPEGMQKMNKINDCIDCGVCKERCPYGIDCPNLMRSMLKDYEEFVSNI